MEEQPTRKLEERIAAELAAAIARRGLTQKQAALQLGTSAKHLNMVLRLKSVATLPTITKWSERLGITWEVNALDARTEALRDQAGGPLSK